MASEAAPPIGAEPAVVDTPVARDVVVVSGPDARSYLQGQLSQDIAALVAGGSTWSFLLDPSGKLGFWLRVTRRSDDAFLLDVDPGFAEGVIARLTRFKLRTKADIELLEGWTCDAGSRNGDGTASVLAVNTDEGPFVVAAPWPGAEGFDVLRPPSSRAPVPVSGSGVAALEAIRIEAGVPRLGAELVADQTIPGEAGAWIIDASVSFTKGCYTGQELVARIDSRGNNVPHRLRGLVIDTTPEALPDVGDEIVVADEVVGRLTSVAWSPGLEQGVGLAYLGRRIEPPVEAAIRGARTAWVAAIRELPLVAAVG